MRIIAIIQARMASTRLPNKVLADLGGQSVLARVVRRASRAQFIDRIVVATTNRPEDDAIVRACAPLGVACYRGKDEDVLDRYHRAAELHGADVVVRVTSDNPLLDPEVADRVIGIFLARCPDYASNSVVHTYPLGLDVEVMMASSLAQAWREAREDYQRAHVTPYFYQNPEWFRIVPVRYHEDLSAWRWTVDYPEDLDFVREVYRRFGNNDRFSWNAVRRLLEAEPWLTQSNRHLCQKQLVQG